MCVLLLRGAAAQAESPSQTQTVSSSPTPSATPVWTTLFDGTAQQAQPVLTGADSTTALTGSSLAAVSFVVSESDAACGPGQWSLTQLVLPLSRSTGGNTTLTLQLFQANVRSGGRSGVGIREASLDSTHPRPPRPDRRLLRARRPSLRPLL